MRPKRNHVILVVLFAAVATVMLTGLWLPRADENELSVSSDANKKLNVNSSSQSLSTTKATESQPEQVKQQQIEAYGKLPLQFEANLGQSDKQVRFISRGRGYTMFLTATEAVLSLRQGDPETQRPLLTKDSKPKSPTSSDGVLRMKLVGANVAASIIGEDELPGKANYFIGNDPKKWRANVGTYKRVRYENLYPGIDLVYYGNNNELEFDYVIAPGSDPRSIRLEFKGAKQLVIDGDGALVVKLEKGDVRLNRPTIYQTFGNERKEVKGKFVLNEEQQLAFSIGNYDLTKPLIIDPTLVYSTYLGGNDTDRGFSIAADSAGNAYVAGYTNSSNFPSINGLPPSTAGADAFITKINPSGNAIVYSSYLGGAFIDRGFDIGVDGVGNAYVIGSTCSSDFPIVNALQSTIAGGCDAFVTKVSASGSSLVYSTYLGGSGLDADSDSSGSEAAIAVDGVGNVWVTGGTSSLDFPLVNAVRPTFGGGFYDVFVSRINSTGTMLVYSTYLGGDGTDLGTGIAVDSVGAAYVTGRTFSNNFPTVNAFQTGPTSNTFVTKINGAGTFIAYSTYLGAPDCNATFGTGIAVDSSGSAYVTGYTFCPNFPSVNAAQALFGAFSDGFVTKFSPAGNTLIYSTFIGGSEEERALDIAIDSNLNAYITGYTTSNNFPVTNALQGILGGGNDAFIAKLSAAGNSFLYSTYLGGSSTFGEEGLGIANHSGKTFIVGNVSTGDDFPITPGAVQTTRTFGDAFVAKIDEGTNTTYFAIKGQLRYATGEPLEQPVTVTLTGSQNKTISSGENGVFIFSLLNSGGNYTVTPDASFSFSPAQRNYSLTSNVTNADFTSSRSVFSIGGRVTFVDGSGASDVPIALSGPTVSNTFTDFNGFYSFTYLPAGGNYSVTPNSTFPLSPSQRSYPNLTQNVTNANFQQPANTVLIKGRLTNVNGRSLSGRTISLTGSSTASTSTDQDGNYIFLVTSGGSYTVSPEVGTVSSWSPTQRQYTNLTQNIQNADFTANLPTFTVAGAVKSASGTIFSNVIVRLSGNNLQTIDYLTNSNGYTSNALNVLGDYTFTPQPFTVAGVTYSNFSPSSAVFFSMLTCSPQNLPPNAHCSGFDYLGVDFIASSATVPITIQTNPAARTVSIDGGAAVTAPVNVQWTPGSQHTIATTSPQADTTGTQYVWSNWSDGGAISHTVTAPGVATTYTANFTTQHQLTMVAGSGGTVLPASGSFFNQGQSVQITATPNVGFVFSGWSGTGTGSFTGATNPVSITMNGPITQTATFAAANSIQFSNGAVSQTEDGKQISVTVNRSNSTASASVDYTTSDTAGVALCHVIANVASSRCDYLITLGTIQFAAGESAKTIDIPIVDDVYAEGSETFAISLSNPVGATLGSPSTAQLTITDNETSNGTNPINTASFFVRQHYLDFLNREPDAGGLNFWADQITSCGADAQCVEVKRINVSAAFFISIEFQETGYLVYRLYKTSFGNLSGGAPVPVRFIDFLRDTQQIGRGVQVGAPGSEALLEANKVAFVLAYVQRSDFQVAFPNTMTAEEFVSALDTNAGAVLSVAEKANLIAVLGATPADIAKRASVLRSVAEDSDLKDLEF